MATRSIIRFAKREAGVTFNEHPETWDAQFYAHWDGYPCLLYTSPSPRDAHESRMPSSA